MSVMAKHPTLDELGEPDLKIAGFQIWIHSRQFPGAEDSDDGNWLNVTTHVGASGTSVWASGAILMTSDFAQLAGQCESLGKNETDEAWLGGIEPELKMKIQHSDQLGHFSMRVEITPDYLSQQHSFEFEIDQTYLPEIARQCRSIIKKHPVRGTAR
jgi:hypothetical protein